MPKLCKYVVVQAGWKSLAFCGGQFGVPEEGVFRPVTYLAYTYVLLLGLQDVCSRMTTHIQCICILLRNGIDHPMNKAGHDRLCQARLTCFTSAIWDLTEEQRPLVYNQYREEVGCRDRARVHSPSIQTI